jgi:hypothetical protein
VVELTASALGSRTPLARAARTHERRDGGMAGTAPVFVHSLVSKAYPLIPATSFGNTHNNVNVVRLHLMHGIHIVKPCDNTIDACLSRQLHKTVYCSGVIKLISRFHIRPFNTRLDCLGRAGVVAGWYGWYGSYQSHCGKQLEEHGRKSDQSW